MYNSEEEFLKNYDSSMFEKLSVTSDILIFSVADGVQDNYRKLNEKHFSVLLVKRDNYPFKDKWCLPGGFINTIETSSEAAKRILKNETNLENIYLEQLYTFGDPLRYPNTRVITCAYFALLRAEDIDVKIMDESVTEIGWHSIEELPPLAFDHKEIIEYSLKRTRERLELCPVAFQLLPKKFTLTELQKSYELILKKDLDKRNFRKKMLSTNMLIDLNECSKTGSKRPAALYSFDTITLDSKRGHFFS